MDSLLSDAPSTERLPANPLHTEPAPNPQQPVRTLEIVGCDRDGIDPRTARVIASALDELHAKYPIPVRGIEIGELGPGTLGVVQPSGPGPRAEGGSGFWLVLDETLVRQGSAEEPRWFRRKFERAVYTAVVQEYARALDRAGNFRAHDKAWQAALTDSLHGGNGGYNALDPAQALVDGFTEVILRGKRAGNTAKLLHDALAEAASKNVVEHQDSQPAS
ncbi:hypothetical protein [Nocardia blacklockiae]|uniref:hypothetical protein n=1 Tax=Nocardia blacklockiae TaxID=480036 RepID=UPI0018933DDE|nr:hypothetical protein [Nocardia blacklockiae]MBF6175567.1 hypothetical protein [Nocardia blacklockiae]